MKAALLKTLASITTPAKFLTLRRITEFEGLRAILAWWVVSAHMLQACGFKAQTLPQLFSSVWLLALNAAMAQSLQIKHFPFNVVARVLNHPLPQNLGKVSYSTYVTHILVFWVLMWLTMAIYPDVNRPVMLIVSGSIGTLSIAALSFALYRWIEKPFIQIGKQVSNRMSDA